MDQSFSIEYEVDLREGNCIQLGILGSDVSGPDFSHGKENIFTIDAAPASVVRFDSGPEGDSLMPSPGNDELVTMLEAPPNTIQEQSIPSVPIGDEYPNSLSSGNEAFIDPQLPQQLTNQYISTSVPLPHDSDYSTEPMMEWNNNVHQRGNVRNQINNTMRLHSPIVPSAMEKSYSASAHLHSETYGPPQKSYVPSKLTYKSHAMPSADSYPCALSQPIALHSSATTPACKLNSHPDADVKQNQRFTPHSQQNQSPMPPTLQTHISNNPSLLPKSSIVLSPDTNKSSSFWLQDEEERFLLGLRLYGWGQWKRIQSIVRTRTNKQIKSHAQKREKVNPEIKYKYTKDLPRRGRISSKALATDCQITEVSVTIMDEQLAPMEELWRDVYGTNNSVGPNSRLRRYRNSASYHPWLEQSMNDLSDKEQKPLFSQVKSEKNTKKKITAEAAYLQEHNILKNVQKDQAHTSVPLFSGQQMPLMPYRCQPHDHHLYRPTYSIPPPQGIPPARTSTGLSGSFAVPLTCYHHHHSPPTLAIKEEMPPHTTVLSNAPPPIIQHANTLISNSNTLQIPKNSKEESLRPGMRVYARGKKLSTWAEGVIYSAKLDPNKAIDTSNAAVPLIYHIQFDGGEEDPEVEEDFLMGKDRYEAALHELEKYFDLTSYKEYLRRDTPLQLGASIYAQWMDKSDPTTHARWLPGTIHSINKVGTGDDIVYTYHILFDNDAEKRDVGANCVLDRAEYHELVKLKYQNQPSDPSSTPIEEIYNIFSKGDGSNPSGNGQGMDLLFTASQMAIPMDTPLQEKIKSKANNNFESGNGQSGFEKATLL